MKDNSYRILKLQSGEELITRIIGRKNKKLIIERPMKFHSSTITDPYGRAKEITVLKNWLLYTSHEQTTIPFDFVVSFLKPDRDVMRLYELEKKKDDQQNKQKKRIIKDPRGPRNEKKGKFNNSEEIENMLNLFNKFNNDKDMIEKFMNSIEELTPEEIETLKNESNDEEFENMISMTVFLPPEALMTLVDSGLIEEEQIKSIIDALSEGNKSSKEMNDEWFEKKFTDFDPMEYGNNWKDWSPYPSDYTDLDDF